MNFNFLLIIMFKVKNSNEFKKMKMVKNNKLVYDYNLYFSDIFQYGSQKNTTKTRKQLLRSSSYRGVSKNGNKWQTSLMNHKKKYYFGNFNSEETAAKIYDFFSIKFKGKKAVTNFFYGFEQIKKINEIEFDKIVKRR